jgi:putative Mg2+ transporter-C (MgtC) family protein
LTAGRKEMPSVHELINQIFPNASNGEALLRVAGRLATAIVLGGVVGIERQVEGKTAGVRTHMLVSLGAALFAVVSLEVNHDAAELTKVIQGVAAGIGFLGAGSILKASNENEVKGLTTAAGIWMTAGIGLAAGAGLFWPAVLGVALAWLVLGTFHSFERWWKHRTKPHAHKIEPPHPPPP